MTYENFLPLVEVTRGTIVESVHWGVVAVVDASGRLVASFGDVHTISYLRSTAKPFQALPFVEMGGVEKFGLTDRELAVMCASHSGTDEHVKVLRGIHAKVGISEENLLCGMHPSYHEPTAKAMQMRGEPVSPFRHNCSGKHTGMLAHARLKGYPIEDYINPSHPVQKNIFRVFAEMTDFPQEKFGMGIDGCSAPVFAVPLYNAALAFARLCDPTGLAAERAVACRKITRAMSTNPDMVAGPDRFDTLLMEVAKGRLVAKGGAEAYQGIGVLPGAMGPGSPALGITLKIADGDHGGRAVATVAMEVMRQLGVLSADELAELKQFDRRPIYNWRHFEVGEIRPCFSLNR
jgi:L-asparaginase II